MEFPGSSGWRDEGPPHEQFAMSVALAPLEAVATRRATWWQRVGPLLGLAVLCVALAVASPHFLTVDNLLNVLRQSAINAVLALGQLMVIITAGIDLSIGSLVGLAYAVAHVFLTRTVYGRDLYAIGGNREAARLCGIPVDRRLNMAYALSGGAAGLAAVVLAARMNSGFPLAGSGAELDAIAAVIIGGASFFGGVGTVGGTLIGALIIGFLRNGLNLLDVSAFWQMIVIGVVIVVAVFIDVLRQRVGRH